MAGVKETIKNIMSASARKEYYTLLQKAQLAQGQSQKEKEDALMKQPLPLSVEVVSLQAFCAGELPQTDIILVQDEERGFLSPVAKQFVANYFAEHTELLLAYGDMDFVVCTEKEREEIAVPITEERKICPYYRPCPSPETLRSFLYVGGTFAFRKELSVSFLAGENAAEMAYAFLLEKFYTLSLEKIGHIPEILEHQYYVTADINSAAKIEKELREKDICEGTSVPYQKVKEQVLHALGKNGKVVEGHFRYALPASHPKISILIPSKDNPKVLQTCIESICEKTTYDNYEIIVVDNGSAPENKACVEGMAKQYGFGYLYEPQPFNYSRMNNQAAKAAAGVLFLLLNDDMEVMQADWLDILAGEAMQADIGAVGAKLYYPGTKKIQHVGITNSSEDGPIHKYIGAEDVGSYGHGRNLYDQNVIGVTGACLMVKKADFEAAGGLDETLQVGYNDVDLCFTLLERGKRNVLRNDVCLYHHESLSRGHDISSEKVARLDGERRILYDKHPGYYFADPYDVVAPDSQNLGDSKQYFEAVGKHRKEVSGSVLKAPEGISINLEWAGKIPGNDDGIYTVRGTMVVPDVDNATYRMSLLLAADEKVYELPVQRLLRPELTARHTTAENVKMGGFAVFVKAGQLPAGTYKILGRVVDTSSRRRLTHDTGKQLRIE